MPVIAPPRPQPKGKFHPSLSAARAALLWKQSGLDAKAAKAALSQNNPLQCGFLALQAALAALAALAHKQREAPVVMYSLPALLGQCAPSLQKAFIPPQGPRKLGQWLGIIPTPPPRKALEMACLRLEQAQQANPFIQPVTKPNANQQAQTRQQAQQHLTDCKTVRNAAKIALKAIPR